MLDQIAVSPLVHLLSGATVLVSTFAAALICSLLAWKKRQPPPLVRGLLVFVQIVMLWQILIGIKLLDQGLGIVQHYEHYIGGFLPLLCYLSYYWFPQTQLQRRSLQLALTTVSAFVLAISSFALGWFGARG